MYADSNWQRLTNEKQYKQVIYKVFLNTKNETSCLLNLYLIEFFLSEVFLNIKNEKNLLSYKIE